MLGGIRRGTLARGEGHANFTTFFRELGPEYVALLAGGFDAYGLLRCGMAHEYLIKGTGTAAMHEGEATCGVIELANGNSKFSVERYYKDFAAAAQGLYADVMSQPQAQLPTEIAGR